MHVPDRTTQDDHPAEHPDDPAACLQRLFYERYAQSLRRLSKTARQAVSRQRAGLSSVLMLFCGRLGAAAEAFAAAPDAFASMAMLMHMEGAFGTGSVAGRPAEHAFVLIALMLVDFIGALGARTVAA